MAVGKPKNIKQVTNPDAVLAFYITEGLRTQRTWQRIAVGVTNTVGHPNNPIQMCSNGMHASRNVLDAAKFCSWGMVTVVVVSGDIKEDNRKLCGRARKTLAILNKKQSKAAWGKVTLAFLHEARKRGMCSADELAEALKLLKPRAKGVAAYRKRNKMSNRKFHEFMDHALDGYHPKWLAYHLTPTISGQLTPTISEARLHKIANDIMLKEAGL